MKISIALATYNGETFIQQQLNSILEQTRLPDEFIIVDDGSTDSTISILRHFKKEAPFSCTIIASVKNRGTAYAFKSAIDLCKSDIIVFCDQDDIWNRKKLEKIEKAFIQTPNIDYVISDASLIDENSNNLGYTLWQQKKFNRSWINRFNAGEDFKALFLKRITTGMTTAINQRIKQLGNYKPSNVIHDAWYIYAASILNYKGKLIDETLLNYRQHNHQQFGSIQRKFLNNLLYSLKKNKEVIDSNLKILKPLFDFAKNHIEVVETHKLEFLAQKVSHFESRKRITEVNYPSRIIKISRELYLGRYQKYSSVSNVIFDFLAF